MANNLEITIFDFENICRTCLARKNLKPLYEKCSAPTSFAEMLMSCTFLKFTEDDGLPAKICISCIKEINQAFSFAKRCETTNTVLRKCVKKVITELANNSSQSQKVQPIINAEEKITPELILSNSNETVEEVLEQKEDVNYSADKNYARNVDDHVKTSSKKSDNPANNLRSRSTNSQTKKVIFPYALEKEGGVPPGKKRKKTHQREKEDNLPVVDKHLVNSPSKVNADVSGRTCNKSNSNICSICNKTFLLNSSLKTHMRVHTRQKYYSCGVCDKSFYSKANLINHKRCHTGEKPNRCCVCDKFFRQYSHLQRHMKVHTGEKPYVCGVCNKRFAYSNSVKYHMTLHTGEGPYKCKVCNKVFTHSSSLNYHMKIHTGEKSYVCEVCSMAFTQPSTLNYHLRTHTKVRYTCPLCPTSFPQLFQYNRHMSRLHPG